MQVLLPKIKSLHVFQDTCLFVPQCVMQNCNHQWCIGKQKLVRPVETQMHRLICFLFWWRNTNHNHSWRNPNRNHTQIIITGGNHRLICFLFWWKTQIIITCGETQNHNHIWRNSNPNHDYDLREFDSTTWPLRNELEVTFWTWCVTTAPSILVGYLLRQKIKLAFFWW